MRSIVSRYSPEIRGLVPEPVLNNIGKSVPIPIHGLEPRQLKAVGRPCHQAAEVRAGAGEAIRSDRLYRNPVVMVLFAVGNGEGAYGSPGEGLDPALAAGDLLLLLLRPQVGKDRVGQRMCSDVYQIARSQLPHLILSHGAMLAAIGIRRSAAKLLHGLFAFRVRQLDQGFVDRQIRGMPWARNRLPGSPIAMRVRPFDARKMPGTV